LGIAAPTRSEPRVGFMGVGGGGAGI